jgi:hypothetical protein
MLNTPLSSKRACALCNSLFPVPWPTPNSIATQQPAAISTQVPPKELPRSRMPRVTGLPQRASSRLPRAILPAMTGFVGRVTARDASTITVSLTAVAGTPPADGTGDRTLKIGGVWKGPNGAEEFPVGFIAATLTNAAGDTPRVNLKNNAQYDITAAMGGTGQGPICWQGYSSTVGDGGRAIIDGGTSVLPILDVCTAKTGSDSLGDVAEFRNRSLSAFDDRTELHH